MLTSRSFLMPRNIVQKTLSIFSKTGKMALTQRDGGTNRSLGCHLKTPVNMQSGQANDYPTSGSGNTPRKAATVERTLGETAIGLQTAVEVDALQMSRISRRLRTRGGLWLRLAM